MTNDPRIQTAKDLAKIKGMENSPFVLLKWFDKLRVARRGEASEFSCFRDDYVGPYLRLAYEDGKWSSASIARVGLELEIRYECCDDEWTVNWKCNSDYSIICTINPETGESEFLTDPAADELAMQLGIIEYHKHYPKEVEDYLEGLK